MGLSFDDFCKGYILSVEVRDGLIALGFKMRDGLFVVTGSEYKQAVLQHSATYWKYKQDYKP